MNYEKIYFKIINNRKLNSFNGYTECHHIIPRSLGGSDDKDNLVNLSAREHFICHLLLTKIYTEKSKQAKMIRAAMMMFCESSNQQRYFSSHTYQKLREHFSMIQSESQSGIKNSQHNTVWIFHELIGPKKVDLKLLCQYIDQGWFKGRSLTFCKSIKIKEKREKTIKKKVDSTLKIKAEAEQYFDLFKNGNYESLREFARKIYPKSHVYLTKIWKLYIPDYCDFVKQGKKFNSKIL